MMDKHTTKGFTLIETLFCMMIISIMVSLCIPIKNHKEINVSFKEVMHLYYLQSEAIVKKEKQEYIEGLTYNSRGNINHAATIHFDHYDLVFQLGNGRFYVRR